jgi:hypothetical protein
MLAIAQRDPVEPFLPGRTWKARRDDAQRPAMQGGSGSPFIAKAISVSGLSALAIGKPRESAGFSGLEKLRSGA